jgi:D-alanine-D-alanine ligase
VKTDVEKWQGRRVGVVMGGLSSEREVSLNSGKGILEALRSKGWDAVAIDWSAGTQLPILLAEAGVQIVFNALHGTYGEDGAVQGLCACMGLPCTGSGILASALAMDKVASKRIFESHGVPTPRWAIVPPDADAAATLAGWSLPLVVKPGNEGSSVGVTVVLDAGPDGRAVGEAVARARECRGPTLVEEYVPGAEVCVGILDDEIIGSCEIRPSKGFYDYEAKYLRGDTAYIIPPELSPEILGAVEQIGFAAYQALGCSGYGRTDLRVTADGRPYVLEVNTLPGMTGTSLIPKIARGVGLDYPTLCERILASAQ